MNPAHRFLAFIILATIRKENETPVSDSSKITYYRYQLKDITICKEPTDATYATSIKHNIEETNSK